ncbi:phosphatidylserine synthase [Acrasis kona]|uniref:Phosphatidylserine synthase n=1 Tax=Acrasis kona TaxID=1008807 RepID=A0AAW2YM74_9EUKA
MKQDQLRNRKKVPTPHTATLKDQSKDQDGELRVRPFLQEEHFIDALYKPHTATVLLLLIISIVYFSFIKDDAALTTEQTTKRGIVAVVAVFLVYCAVQLRDGIILRPHPAFWRVVTGAGIVSKICFYIKLIQQSRDNARQYLRYLYPDLGVPLPEKSYGDSCDIFTPNDPDSYFKNVKDVVWDEFIIAHVIGYVGKALLFRDMKLCWILSLFFEVMEITFQHWLANFKECWWDHLIVDVLICNNAGIMIGLWLCDLLKMKKYPLWIGVSDIPTTRGKIVRVLEQFTPFNWTSYNWNAFDSPKLFFYSIGIVIAMTIVDLNAFFLKYELWVPPSNPLNVYRLILWFFVGMPAIREYYQFVSDPKTKRLGANAWIVGGIISLESLLVFKYSSGLFNEPFPPHIWVPWTVSGIFFVLWFIGFFIVADKKKREGNRVFKSVLNVLLTCWILPLVVMFFMGCPDLRWGQDWFDSLPWWTDQPRWHQ